MSDFKSWLPIRLPNDIQELTELYKCEKKLGDPELAEIMKKYLKKLKENENEKGMPDL